jgi:serine/threonine-protein kinase
MVMVYVPAGEFQMGSTEGEDDEQPVHTVALDGFWIDRTEVTNAQYAQCVAAGACKPPSGSGSTTRDGYYDTSTYADYPVIWVNWDDVQDYCAWAGAQLPTEAQWEYAARGPEPALSGVEGGHVYPWGDRAPNCDTTNFSDCMGDTTAVGAYPAGASWCGALDLAGNVWEWTADWYGEYPSERQENPTGPATGSYRVVRGGGWNNGWSYVRAAHRYYVYPVYRGYVFVGFRCVGSPGE